MHIILKKNIPALGQENDQLTVKDGYASYLIANGQAVVANTTNKKIALHRQKQLVHKHATERQAALDLAAQLNKREMILPVKLTETGKIYGKITPAIIAAELAKEHITLEPKQITLPKNLKEPGLYQVTITLYRDVTAELKLEVTKE